MGVKFDDYIALKNRWEQGHKISFQIDEYSDVVQIHVGDTINFVLNEDEVREFIKVLEKSYDILRRM